MESNWFVAAKTIGLLFLSNCFMTAAWYGHLRYKQASLLTVILVSWMIALPEYMLQVPSNRMGHGLFTAYQLKIFQECIALTVFIGFAWFALGEAPQIRYMISFGLILVAVVVAVWK